MQKHLGKIKKLSLREVFKSESQDFTPWLEQNVRLLSDAVGIEITDVKREEGVGDFNADLIGVEANSEDKVLIENQLEQTNHDHLGKLVTYAAGIEAKYVIWVSEKIREEHQQALEWLNENLRSDISLFGVEAEMISVDGSNPAPYFRLVVEPNSWGRGVKEKTERSDERHQGYLKFYTRLVAEYEKKKPDWGHLTPRPSSWLAFGAGKVGFRFNWAFRGNNRFDVELYIDTKDQDEVKALFAELQKFASEVNKQIPELSWEELPERRASRVAIYYSMPAPVKNLTNDQTDDLISWAIEKMDLFKKVFTPYIKKLSND